MSLVEAGIWALAIVTYLILVVWIVVLSEPRGRRRRRY